MLKRKCKSQLLRGDCFEVLDNLPEKSVDLVVTDPPYDLKTTGGGGTINRVKKLNKSLKDLTIEGKDITQSYDIKEFGEKLIRVMKSVNVYFRCNKAQIPEYFNFWVNEQKCKFDILCWHKTNALPTYSNKYLSDTEYLLHFFKGSGTVGVACKNLSRNFIGVELVEDYYNIAQKRLGVI